MSVWGENEAEARVTKDFVEVERSDQFVAYAGGFAASLLIRLHNHEGITPYELLWLKANSGLDDPDAACQKLIDAYQLQCVTKRITS